MVLSVQPIEFELLAPPDCVTPEVFDVTGTRVLLDSLCLEEALPATAFDETGNSTTPSATTAAEVVGGSPDEASTAAGTDASDDGPELSSVEQTADPSPGCTTGVALAMGRAPPGVVNDCEL